MQVPATLLKQILSFQQNNVDFEISKNSEGQFIAKPKNLLQKINKILHANSQDISTVKTAEFIATALADLPRVPPSTAIHDDICKIGKNLLKNCKELQKNSLPLKELKIQLAAYKLGISKSNLESPNNQGFLEFASNPPLERYLAEFNHELKIAENGELLILHQNEYISWKKAKEITKTNPKDPTRFQIWNYGMTGVQNVNAFEFDTLTPYKKEDPKTWNCKYIFELCCCCDDKPRFVGDHTWIRLKTPEGDIYSVGLYRPLNVGKKIPPKLLRIRKGLLMQPDISEFWPITIHRIPFEITKEQFLKMKAQIEEDKHQDKQILEAFGKNCTEYAEKIGAIAEINLPLAKPVWKLLTHKYASKKIVTTVEFLQPFVPSNLSFVCEKITSFWSSSALSLFGVRTVDDEVHIPNQISVKPKFNSFLDLFNSEKCKMKHPHTVGHEIENLVWNHRHAEIEKLIKEKEQKIRNGSSFEELKKLDEQISNAYFMKVS